MAQDTKQAKACRHCDAERLVRVNTLSDRERRIGRMYFELWHQPLHPRYQPRLCNAINGLSVIDLGKYLYTRRFINGLTLIIHGLILWNSILINVRSVVPVADRSKVIKIWTRLDIILQVVDVLGEIGKEFHENALKQMLLFMNVQEFYRQEFEYLLEH